ncbi:DUF2779 domain-containing protein [Helicobacter sp. 23-1046]
MSINLSKSQYLRGLQCKKSLWLYKYAREIQDTPSESQLARFESGDRVGELALKLFDCTEKIDFDEGDFAEKIARTQALIASGVSAIAEATFEYKGVIVMVDILQITPQGLIINEVKSATSLKGVYIDDLAIQYFVITQGTQTQAPSYIYDKHAQPQTQSQDTQNAHKVIGANLIHINNSYERNGELELEKLFTKVDCLESVRAKQGEVAQNLAEFENALSNTEISPQIPIGAQCSTPYNCDFRGYCWHTVPKQDSIFHIAGRKSFDPFALYHSGIRSFSEIEDFGILSESQKLQVQSALKKEVHIDKGAIKAFLDTLAYPVYHLDFETFAEAVPSFDKQRAYMQIPFQYSLHIEGLGEAKEVAHREFLADWHSDPREAFIQSLIKDIPQDACILAYNASFEKGVMKNLAESFPKYAEALENFIANTHDLMIPFKDKSYYHHAMNGSYSIKAVLPALAPEMERAYQNLELIHNGDEAMSAFPRLKQMSENERESYRAALLEYCKLDTLAMLKVLEKLREVARD